MQSHDIAVRQDIPEPYLNQLLTLLRKAGLISSRRGPGGGHMLARPASEITVADLVSALEGPSWPGGDGVTEPSRRSACLALREVWLEAEEASQRVLARVTLADLLERERRRTFTYSI